MVLRTAARVWYARMLQAAPFTPFPRDGPVIRVGDGAPDRVLLLGNGPLHGWGVTRRELTVPGHLARVLHDRSGRPAAVEYVGDERMDAASAVAWSGSALGRAHDVVVIAMGMNDALRLTDVRRWRTDVHRLLDLVLHETAPRAPVLLVGLPHIRRYVMADTWLGGLAQRRATAMTAVLQEAAAGSSRVTFVPAPVERFEAERPLGSSAMYLAWAEDLAGHLLSTLDEVRALGPASPEPALDWDWAGTPEMLDLVGSGPGSPVLESMVEAVKERFGVALATVNLVDGDRVYPVAGAAGVSRALPRSLVYCDTVIEQDAPLVVLDAKRDDRFRDNPLLELLGLPFYAGVPLHARDGTPIATLCVFDTSARKAFDVRELQQLGSMVEIELRGREPAAEDSTALRADPAR